MSDLPIGKIEFSNAPRSPKESAQMLASGELMVGHGPAATAVRQERAACAALVRAANCLCLHLAEADDLQPYFNGQLDHRQEEPVIRHDSRCPISLALAIEARAKAPSPEVTDV